ncbi:MAG: class I SAM-dependent methyltransferase [Candidatus Bathyarchaeota archaeon]|nr:class I SAM-dependent methyltransferase [Candidatus Bathyarchaeota archaeon]
MEKCSGVNYDQPGHLKRWEKDQANDYLKHSSEEYPKALNDLIRIRPEDSILDIGCGPGVLALPFSLISKSVTVVDISENMLKVLHENAAAKGITNIKSVNKCWLDTCVGADISQGYDVVISSNSINLLGAQETTVNNQPRLEWDLVAALKKMNQLGKRIYLSFPLFIQNHLSSLKHLGKKSNPWPDYVILHNILYQLGIRPNINILKFTNTHFDDAYLRHCKSWVHDLRDHERDVFERQNGDQKVPGLRRNQLWGVFWWKT